MSRNEFATDEVPDTPAAPRISVVIHPLNEEHNLSLCLACVKPWADEIIVNDQRSNDRCVDVARSFGAQVFVKERSEDDPMKNFSLSEATGDWVLVIDADEMVPRALSEKLIEFARFSTADILLLPRENFFAGKIMRATGWGPTQDYQMRFFRRGAVQARPIVHHALHAVDGASMERLPYQSGCALVHLMALSMRDQIERTNLYTTFELKRSKYQDRAPGKLESLWRAFRWFWLRYVQKAGYLDGWRGFYLSLLMGFYTLAIDAKVTEKSEFQSEEAVKRTYDSVAHKLSAEYKANREVSRVPGP